MATVLKNKIEKSYLTDQERWEAVIHRDKNAADAFLYLIVDAEEPLSLDALAEAIA
jgi:methylphosphotriester-DNA--protein-cysteine methyltransferase